MATIVAGNGDYSRKCGLGFRQHDRRIRYTVLHIICTCRASNSLTARQRSVF